MGLLDYLKRKFFKISSTPHPAQTLQPDCPGSPATPVVQTTRFESGNITNHKLTYAEKELIMVQRVKIEDMQKLSSLPYVWNNNVEKLIEPHTHPFAYMELTGPNITIARQELEKMSSILSNSNQYSSIVPKHINIPINDIVFAPQEYYGHTQLICTPYTFTGEPASYPVSLCFMTDLSNDANSTHGDLYYGQDGTIKKATIYCWRNGIGYFFYYITLDERFILEKIEYTGKHDEQMRPSVIYKAPHILELETQRIQEEKDFAWIQENIAEKCPKSLSGFRRMKTQNTKNYQTLKSLAAELGREI